MRWPSARNLTAWQRSNRRIKTGTLGAWLQSARSRLSVLDEHISVLHALIQALLGKSAAWQITHPDHILTDGELNKLEALLARLLDGEPLAYITGKQAFYGRDFHVNPSVLIPRPETELLVELAIADAQSIARPLRVADVGTGSGCIAISLAKELDSARITATDISSDALSTASLNATLHQAGDQVLWIQCNLMDAVKDRFDIICANLPYIPVHHLRHLEVSKYEPKLALDGGADGLCLIRPLLDDLKHIRKPRCTALFEIDQSQGEGFLSISRSLYPHASIKIEKDLAGKDRVGIIQFIA